MSTIVLIHLLLAQVAAPVPASLPAPAPGIQAAAAPAAVARAPQDVRAAFTSLNWSRLDPQGWLHIAEYYGLRGIFVLILMTLAWTASGWGSGLVRRALTRVKFDETLTIFLAKLVRYVILLLVGLMCLSKFGVETTGFAAVIGAAGLAIGLAFQGTLSNFAAGAMLLIFRPYKVGDTVNVAGFTGTVREIELFTTSIDTPDNRRVIIPNSSIFGAVIENITHHPLRRAEVDVGVAYSADIDATRTALERAARSVALVALDPPATAVLMGLGNSSVNWQLRGYVPRDKFLDGKQALIRAAKIELERARIEIPFPQLDVRIAGPLLEEPRAAAA